jgi:hypothetical protein
MHLRLAAGVGVLTSGLLIGSAGGAIAAADTESTGSTSTQTQAADEPSQSVSPVSEPTGTITSTPPKSTRPPLRDIIRKLQMLGKPRQRPVVVKATKDPLATDTETDNHGSGAAAASTEPAASDSNVESTDSNVTAPPTNVAASDSNGPAPSTDLAVPLLTVVAPVTNAVATVAGVALSVPGVVMSLPTSQSPVADVITSVQDMLTSITDAVVPLAQLPSDLYSLVGAAAANATVVYGGNESAGMATAAGAPLPPPMSPLPLVVPTVSGDVPLLGDVTAPTVLSGIAAAGLTQDLSLSGTAPLTAEGTGPRSALSFLEHTVRAVLAPASLSALAAIALPGIGGLLIICAAGMRLGYRQAKAAVALRSTGIARFAPQGPIGVVRSGSLVALHPRALRAVGPEVSQAAPLLQVA